MNRLNRLFKAVQRKLLDFLLTKYGVTILCLSILVVLVCLIQLSDTILEYKLLANIETLKTKSYPLRPRINNGKFFETSNTLAFSNNDVLADSALRSDHVEFFSLKTNIDAVYTWVNGSDPQQIKQMRKYKNRENATSNYEMFDQFYARVSQNNRNETKLECYHKFCMQTNNLIAIKPKLTPSDRNSFILNSKLSNLNEFMQIVDSQTQNVTIVEFDFDLKINTTLLNRFFSLRKKFAHLPYEFRMAYYTIDDCSLIENCIQSFDQTFIAKRQHIYYEKVGDAQKDLKERLRSFYLNNNFLMAGSKSKEKSDESEIELPKSLDKNLLFKFDYLHAPSSSEQVFDGSNNLTKTSKKKDEKENSIWLSVFKVNSKKIESSLINNYVSTKSLLVSNETRSNRTVSYELYQANLVWDLGSPFMDDLSANRFNDNDELKYSLRSLEKYAPWFRHIYLVTNGQIPSWLNLSHPKLRLVRHGDIFLNQSHLPTFSSPAIESHLHRIRGLSKRFVYFNDDILLGKRVYPEDFYTRSQGFKIYLAWQLPGCNQQCPSTWIRDGYCDKTCNTTECDFDGGDCLKNQTNSRNQNSYDQARLSLFNQTHNQLFSDLYCSPGCSTSWLADSYCDNACNNLKCAYDLGDCGHSNYKTDLLGFDLLLQNETIFPYEKSIDLPIAAHSFYVNFSAPNFRIENAQHEDHKSIRKMSIVNKWQLLTVLLMNSTNLNQETFKITLQANLNRNITLLVKLNAFQPQTTTSSSSSTATITKFVPKTYEPILNLSPKYVKLNLNKMTQTNVKFSNKLYNEIYENYHNYLNWSIKNGYLTRDGLNYKLNLLRQKLSDSNLNQLIEDDRMSEDAQLDIMHKFLFNDSTILTGLDKQSLLSSYLSNQTQTEESNLFLRFRKRKLLDTFADSLRHVNKLLNKLYGFAARKVPAHMPHMIDRTIMQLVEEKFSAEFNETSSHKFRTQHDMQYSFSYFYYVMSELDELNASKLFDDEIDLNKNGYLDLEEMRLIGIRLNSKPFSITDYYMPMSDMNKDLTDLVSDCKNETHTQERMSKNEFLRCTSLLDYLKEKIWSNRFKYKFETFGDEETKFVMIGGQPLDIEIKLGNLLRQPTKFMCLNDNIDYKLAHESNELRKLLRQFYTTLFPLKSTFEKNDDPFEYIKPSMLQYDSLENMKNILIVILILISILLAFYFVLTWLFKLIKLFVFKSGDGRNVNSRFGFRLKTKTKQAKHKPKSSNDYNNSSDTTSNKSSLFNSSSEDEISKDHKKRHFFLAKKANRKAAKISNI